MDSISPRMSRILVKPGIPDGITVLDFLSARFPHIEPETWLGRIGEGKVLLGDGSAVTALSPVRPGSEIRYHREVRAEPRIPDAHRILYRDDHILVACKPHFLPVVPGGRFVRECLLYRVLEETGLQGLSPVHRIDRHTAGLVLFSVRAEERARYQDLFRDRRVEKGYLANVRWIAGPPAGDSWELEARIDRDAPTLRRELAPGEANAACRIRLLNGSVAYAALALFPSTGKRHQLRLQVSQIGAAILHDPYYPELLPEAADDPARPLQLLSKTLRFRDPVTLEEREFISPRELLPLPAVTGGAL